MSPEPSQSGAPPPASGKSSCRLERAEMRPLEDTPQSATYPPDHVNLKVLLGSAIRSAGSPPEHGNLFPDNPISRWQGSWTPGSESSLTVELSSTVEAC